MHERLGALTAFAVTQKLTALRLQNGRWIEPAIPVTRTSLKACQTIISLREGKGQ
jgi:hypothetical protein